MMITGWVESSQLELFIVQTISFGHRPKYKSLNNGTLYSTQLDLTLIHQFYDSASTQLRLKSFGTRLENKLWVGTPICQSFLNTIYNKGIWIMDIQIVNTTDYQFFGMAACLSLYGAVLALNRIVWPEWYKLGIENTQWKLLIAFYLQWLSLLIFIRLPLKFHPVSGPFNLST